MTDLETEENLPPVAAVTLVFNGPVAPHWDYQVNYGDEQLVQDFFNRVHARLMLLPKHDPQFRRNRERVNRDAERERIVCSWDLGEDDEESTVDRSQPVQQAAAPEAEAVEEVEVEAADDAEVEVAEEVAEATPETEESEDSSTEE